MPDTTNTMPLLAKGLRRPPPQLAGPAGRVAATIATWTDVIAATHWHLSRMDDVDGADFYVGERELGHIHLDGQMHLATSLPLRKALLAHGLAAPFPWYDNWVQCEIRTEALADHALWLFDLNYRRLRGEDVLPLISKFGQSVQNARILGHGPDDFDRSVFAL